MNAPAHDPAGDSSSSESAMQGYYDWQVTTLMLAYDLQDPIDAQDPDAGEQRRRAIEEHVRRLTLEQVPDIYQSDPSLDWPPSLMMAITRATLQHAAQAAGL